MCLERLSGLKYYKEWQAVRRADTEGENAIQIDVFMLSFTEHDNTGWRQMELRGWLVSLSGKKSV